MADPDHFRRLCEGARAWNAWRDANPDIVPELAGAQLALGQRQFGPSNGGPVNLSGADLERAMLRHATLVGADLRGANLEAADLGYARLAGAHFDGADLSGALLDQADFQDVSCEGAIVAGTNLAGVSNLTQTQVERMQGDRYTVLPSGLLLPERWLRPKRAAQATVDADAATAEPDLADVALVDEPEMPFAAQAPYERAPSWEYEAEADAPRPFAEPLDDDPFELLELDRTATADEIRKAYRRLAKIYHPDLNPGDEAAAQRFKRIEAAHRLLLAPPPPEPLPYRPPLHRSWTGVAAVFVVAMLAPVAGLYWFMNVPLSTPIRHGSEPLRPIARLETESRRPVAMLPEQAARAKPVEAPAPRPQPEVATPPRPLPQEIAAAPVTRSEPSAAPLPKGAAIPPPAAKEETIAAPATALPPPAAPALTQAAPPPEAVQAPAQAFAPRPEPAPAPQPAPVAAPEPVPPSPPAAAHPPVTTQAIVAEQPEKAAPAEDEGNLAAMFPHTEQEPLIAHHSPSLDTLTPQGPAMAQTEPPAAQLDAADTPAPGEKHALASPPVTAAVPPVAETAQKQPEAPPTSQPPANDAGPQSVASAEPAPEEKSPAEPEMAQPAPAQTDSPYVRRLPDPARMAARPAAPEPDDLLALPLPERRPGNAVRSPLQNGFARLQFAKEKRLWAAAARSRGKDAFEAYLRAFPKGTYAGVARQRLAELKAGQQSPQPDRKYSRRPSETAAARPPEARAAFAEPQSGPVQPEASPQKPPAQSSRVRWPSSDEPFVDPMPGAR